MTATRGGAREADDTGRGEWRASNKGGIRTPDPPAPLCAFPTLLTRLSLRQAAVADPFLRRLVLALAATSRGYLLARTPAPLSGAEEVVLGRGEGEGVEVYRRATLRTRLVEVAWATLKGEDRALEKVCVKHYHTSLQC